MVDTQNTRRIPRVKTICLELTATSATSIVQVFSTDSIQNTAKYSSIATEVITNGYIKNFRCKAKIKSLPEITLPVFDITETQSMRENKALSIEWGSPRKQLNCYASSDRGANWIEVDAVSLLNPAGYPYRTYNLLDLFSDNLALELGADAVVGVGLVEAGSGILTSEDKISIFGSYLEEVILVS